MLTARGKAVEAGAMGDVVGVLNIQSNRTVQATVIGPGRVTSPPPGPLIADRRGIPAMTNSSSPRTQ